jgi:hypothetical protein
MARKSKEQILAEEKAKQDEINAGVQAGIASQLPSLVAAATAEIMSRLSSLGIGAGGAAVDPTGGMAGLIKNVAVDLAKLADPRNERRTVSPEIAASREEGKKAMIDLLLEAQKAYEEGEYPPVYVLTNKCFLGGVKVEPKQENATTHRMEDVEINYLRIPNQHMQPVNGRAKKIKAAYLQMISNGDGQLASPPPAPYVLTGNKIRRQGQHQEPPQVGSIESMPLRRHEPTARQRKEIPVLGTLAPPVVETI